MNKAMLNAFSPSARRVLEYLAATPTDAKHFHDRVQILFAAMMIGREVVESQLAAEARKTPPDENELATLKMTAMSSLAMTTTLECCMNALLELHPELVKANASGKPKDGLAAIMKLRVLDLD